MTSLLDIGPLTEEVPVNGKSVTVYGVTPEGFFYLLGRFPALASMFGGEGAKSLEAGALLAMAPEAVAYALAVATTDRSDYVGVKEWKVDVEKAALISQNLSAHYQMAILQAALRLTFPDGIGPFIKGVEALATSINRLSPGAELVTKSSKPSRTGFVTDSVGMRLGPGAPSGNSKH